MVKTPFIVAGVVIAVLLAAIAYFEFRPQPTVVAPAPTVAALPPAPPQPTPLAPPAPQTAADCLLPGPPPVPPDGGSATAADMKLEHDVFQSFVLQLEGYQACREKQIAASGTGATEQQKQTWRAQANAAIDEAQALAGAFAAQLKVYHKKHPEPLPQTPTK